MTENFNHFINLETENCQMLKSKNEWQHGSRQNEPLQAQLAQLQPTFKYMSCTAHVQTIMEQLLELPGLTKTDAWLQHRNSNK